MPYCETCGTRLNEGESCPSCGVKAAESGAPGGDTLLWTAKAPVISSCPVMTQLVLVFGAGVLVLMIFLLIIDAGTALAAAPYVVGTAAFLLLLGVVIAAGMQFLSHGGLTTEFAITPEGIGYRAGKEAETINRAALVGTVIGGSLSGAGGSMINISREMDFMAWPEVRSITVYLRERSLVFYRKTLLFPFALYCTPENFEQVRALARKYAPHARYRERGW